MYQYEKDRLCARRRNAQPAQQEDNDWKLIEQDRGHHHHDQAADHRNCRTANERERTDARTTCHSHHHGGNRRHVASHAGRKLHRHQEQDGRDTELLSEVRHQRREGVERSVARAHHDGGDRNEGHDDDHDGIGGQAHVLGDVNQIIDGTRGDQALGKEFARDDQGDHGRELTAHRVEEVHGGREHFLGGLADQFANKSHREGNEHGCRHVKLDARNHEAVEHEEHDERQHRQEAVPSRSALAVEVILLGNGFVDFVGLFTVPSIKVLLGEVVQHGHGNRGYDTDGQLVFDEVGHRIHAGHLSGVVSCARCRPHVKAGHRDDQGGGGKSGDTEAHEHRVHRHHQEHGQTRSARNEQVSHGTYDVTQSEHEIGGLENAQRTGDVIGHQSACADLGHVGGIAEAAMISRPMPATRELIREEMHLKRSKPTKPVLETPLGRI